MTRLKQWLTVCARAPFSPPQTDCNGGRTCRFSQVFPKSSVEGVFWITNKTRSGLCFTLSLLEVGTARPRSDKSPSFAADIWLSQMENNMDITESDVRSLTLGSLFIIRPSFLIFNHNPIGHDCPPRRYVTEFNYDVMQFVGFFFFFFFFIFIQAEKRRGRKKNKMRQDNVTRTITWLCFHSVVPSLPLRDGSNKGCAHTVGFLTVKTVEHNT